MSTWNRTGTARRLAVLGTVAGLLAAGTTYLVASSTSALAATSAGVWLTTPDRSNLLTAKADVAFGTGGSGPVITVNPNSTYQSMVGFGASFTDAAAYNVFNSPQRNTIMNSLFSPSSGIGLSFLRQPIGASDFSRSFYTYDDGSADPSLSRFSVAHDQSYILPLLTQARGLNPQVSVMGSPWSAPAWMKTNNNLVGGSLNSSYNATYADYLVRFAQEYQNAGVPIAYLSVQNEPQFSPPGYPGMLMSSSQQIDIINALAPKLSAAGLGTKILGWDHNWDQPSYATDVLSSSAGAKVAGTAWHCYGGDPSAQSGVHNAYPNKDIFFTECSGIESGNTFADSLLWQGRNLAIGTTRNWARTVTTWNMALDNNHGPVIGSCTNCMGVVTVNGGSVTNNAEYYVLGHLSKFVKPGAVRVDSTGYGQGGIENVAFRNPDGGIVLVALNSGGTQNFQVSYDGSSFGYSLPGGSMATFTWPGGGGGGDITPPTAPTNVAASGTTSTSTTLSWNASTDNVGVTGYTVYRNNVQVGTTTSTNFTDTGLAASTAYSYAVQARDAAGNQSPPSSALSVTTQPQSTDITPPSTPTGMAASGTTATSTNLTWNASNDNVGVTGYIVYRNGVQVGTSTGTGYADTGLTASTTYSYTVRARDAAGNQSPSSTAVSVTTQTNTDPGIDPTKWYQVVNQNSAKCLDDADWNTGNGASLQQWACNSPNANNQNWQFRTTSDGYVQVVNRHATSLVWDIDGGPGATGDGSRVHLWSYGGGTNQQWQAVALGGGLYKFVARNSGKCLDVRDVSAANGASLQQWTCTGGPAQTFRLVQQP